MPGGVAAIFLALSTTSTTTTATIATPAPAPRATPRAALRRVRRSAVTASGGWKYTMVMPNGSVYGTTNAAGSSNVEYCVECHLAYDDQDSLIFMPEEYRK